MKKDMLNGMELGNVNTEYRLDASVCSYKQSWNDDKCRCECK